MALKTILIHPSISLKAISPKSDNYRLIALAYSRVYHTQTKYINIKYHYIHHKIAAR